MSNRSAANDFASSQGRFEDAQRRRTGLTRGLWLLGAGLVVFLLAMALVGAGAAAREARLDAERAALQAARETIVLTSARLAELEFAPADLDDERANLLEALRAAGLSEPVAPLSAALDGFVAQPGAPIDKAVLSRFRTAAEAALAEIAREEAELAAAAERARDRLQREALLVFLLTLAGLAGAIMLIRRALIDNRALLESAQDEAGRLNALLAASAEGVATLDAGGRLIAANARIYADLRASPGALKGAALGELVELPVDEAVRSGAFATIAAALGTGGETPIETVATRRDGSHFPVVITLAPYRYAGRTHYVVTLRDITRQRELDAEKDAFVSTVTHELRSPLTSISAALDMLVARAGAEDMPAKSRRLVEIAQTNVHRLIRLVNDILDIEKLESGNADLKIEDLSLRSVAEEAMEAYAAYAAPKNIHYRLNMLEPDVTVRGDRDRVMQVASNFLSNAVKASPEGKIVEVSVSRQGETGELAVRDYGPGVPADFEPELFRKFAQAETGAGATGLGLALVREIAERHGGRAYYTPAPKRGAIFTLALPLADLDLPADLCATGAPQIVHFDPDADILRVVAAAFAGRARVEGYVNLHEARDAVNRRCPDAVLADLAGGDPANLTALLAAAQGAVIAVFSSDEPTGVAIPAGALRFIKSRDAIEVLANAVLQAVEAPNREGEN